MEPCREVRRDLPSRRDSYEATKQQLLATQQARYASLSFAQEQRRLRIHLRRILLVNDASEEPRDAKQAHKQAKPSVSHGQWRQWKEDAIARENERLRRHTSAAIIQSRVRRWLTRLQDRELSSTSQFVAFSAEESHFGTALHPEIRYEEPPRSPVAAWAPDLRPTSFQTITEPFQVIAELLGARDLAFPPGSSVDGQADVVADVRLLHQSANTVLGRIETPPLSLARASSDGIQWDDQVLQIGIDPEKLPAERVVAECVVNVEVFVRRSDVAPTARTVPLGRLCVAMDLLETPLADKYAMTRWFPLERSSGGGRPARGEVRMSIRFLMRNEKAMTRCGDEDEDVWVPYAGSSPAVVDPPPRSPPPIKRRATTALMRRRSNSTTKKVVATAPTAASKPPLSPRKESGTPPSQARTRVASPVRLRKVEVISPPSSPSSYSSDGNALDGDTSPQRSPSPRARSPLRRQASGGIVANAAVRARRASVRGSMIGKASKAEDNEDGGLKSPAKEDGDTNGASPKKPFLKRKPYKVVFQKLDWSRVGSKTDSGSGAKGGTSPVRPATQAAAISEAVDKAASVTSPQVIERLAAVVDAVQAACKVTTQTASLAQMKYKTERKRFLTSLTAKHIGGATQGTPSVLSSASAADEALQLLWTELHGDADGAVYSKRLADLLT